MKVNYNLDTDQQFEKIKQNKTCKRGDNMDNKKRRQRKQIINSKRYFD